MIPLCKKCSSELKGKQKSFCSEKCSRRFLKSLWQKRKRTVVNDTKKRWRDRTNRASDNKWRLNSLEKVSAHRKVHYAIRKGKIIRGVCEICGDQKSQAHHDDYSKPLQVRWLCPNHHTKETHKKDL